MTVKRPLSQACFLSFEAIFTDTYTTIAKQAYCDYSMAHYDCSMAV